jgi:hypothetical protein
VGALDVENVVFFADVGATQELERAAFVSTYTPEGSLVVTNEISSYEPDTEQLFDFEIRLTNTVFAADFAAIEATIVQPDGEGRNSITLRYNEFVPFQLGHGWQLDIQNLPQGTQFVINDLGAPNYLSTVHVTVNGATPLPGRGTLGEGVSTDLALSDALLIETRVVGEGENLAAFENYQRGSAPADEGLFGFVNEGVLILGALVAVVVVLFAASRFFKWRRTA